VDRLEEYRTRKNKELCDFLLYNKIAKSQYCNLFNNGNFYEE